MKIAIAVAISLPANQSVTIFAIKTAGAIAKWTGSAAAAFDFGTVVLLACPVLLWGYNRIIAPRPQVA